MKSIVSYPDRGIGGSNKYRGNCSPRLIADLIDQYKLDNLNDYMCGSGTTEDVCKQKGIITNCYDLNRGYDMLSMDIESRAGNIFWHPPYSDIIVYSDVMYKAKDIIDKYGFDPRVNDLSRCRDYDDFVKKMNYCCYKQFSALDKGGRMFILMGDIKKKGKLYSMLLDIAKPGTVEQIIIKAQHNCWSDTQQYSNKNFVPIVHEYCLVLRKDQGLYFDVAVTEHKHMDIRDCVSFTWRDVVVSVLQDAKGELSLAEIYKAVDGHKKTERNIHWKEKIRQTLYQNKEFNKTEHDTWKVAS